MKPARVLVATGIVVYLLCLAWLAPARLATGLTPDGVALAGIEGSLWNGRARHVVVSGHDVGRLDWKLRPGWGVAIELVLSGRAAQLQARLRTTGPGQVTLHALDAQAPARLLAVITGIEGPVEAELAVRGLAAEFEDGRPVKLSGAVLLDGVSLALARRIALGSYRLALGLEDGRIVAEVRDASDVLDVTGTIHMTMSGAWESDLRIAPRTDDAELRRALAVLGEPDADGYRRLRLRGDLN